MYYAPIIFQIIMRRSIAENPTRMLKIIRVGTTLQIFKK